MRDVRQWLVLCGLAGCFVVGCAAQPIAHNVIGPNGYPAVHVACGSDQGACFELAGRSCPGGYDLAPVFDPRDNNFLVSCRAPAPLGTAPQVAQSTSATSWPGPSPWPSTNATIADGNPPPWPSSETRSATGSGSEVDLGY